VVAREWSAAGIVGEKARVDAPAVLVSQRTPRSRRRTKRKDRMETKRFFYYEEDGLFVGWLEEYPDYRTQGESLGELEENLREVYSELSSGTIPCVLKVGELSIA
jgi:hypothetical protein